MKARVYGPARNMRANNVNRNDERAFLKYYSYRRPYDIYDAFQNREKPIYYRAPNGTIKAYNIASDYNESHPRVMKNGENHNRELAKFFNRNIKRPRYIKKKWFF